MRSIALFTTDAGARNTMSATNVTKAMTMYQRRDTSYPQRGSAAALRKVTYCILAGDPDSLQRGRTLTLFAPQPAAARPRSRALRDRPQRGSAAALRKVTYCILVGD